MEVEAGAGRPFERQNTLPLTAPAYPLGIPGLGRSLASPVFGPAHGRGDADHEWHE